MRTNKYSLLLLVRLNGKCDYIRGGGRDGEISLYLEWAKSIILPKGPLQKYVSGPLVRARLELVNIKISKYYVDIQFLRKKLVVPVGYFMTYAFIGESRWRASFFQAFFLLSKIFLTWAYHVPKWSCDLFWLNLSPKICISHFSLW